MRRSVLTAVLVAALARVAGAVCGDRVLDPGEQCDNGNAVAGCCSATCQFEPLGTSCDDHNACTRGDVCNGAGVCAGATHLPCDDHNKCTLDSCHPTDGCHNDPVDFTATLKEFSTPLGAGGCTGTKIPKSIKSRYASASKLVAKGQAATVSKTQRRLVDKAVAQLKKASSVVNKSPKGVVPACLAELRQRVNVARSRAQCLLKTL